MQNLKETQKQYLQNAANICGLIISEWHYEDKRKASKFVARLPNGIVVSPTLDYNSLNHFLLGFNECLKQNKPF
jgi:hypothetical protein